MNYQKTFKIFRLKESNPLINATVQALYSRSKKSLIDIIKDLKINYENFINKYYINYGHKSIGDCGDVTLLIENVSSKVSMTIQHNRLYNGQEKSTRYVNFNTVEPVNILKEFYNDVDGIEESIKIIDDIYSILKECYELVYKAFIITNTKYNSVIQYDNSKDENKIIITDKDYIKALEKYALDYARFFLPIGIRTSLSFKTSISNLSLHLNLMKYGNKELKSVTNNIYKYLEEQKDIIIYKPKDNDGYEKIANEYFSTRILSETFIDTTIKVKRLDDEILNNNIIKNIVENNKSIIKNFPMDFLDNIVITINDTMPYANFRDFHRHRTFNFSYCIGNRDILNKDKNKISDYVHIDVLNVLREVLSSADYYELEEKIRKIIIKRTLLYHNLLSLNLKYNEIMDIMDYVSCFGSPVYFYAKTNLNAFNYLVDLRTKINTHELFRKQIVKWLKILDGTYFENFISTPNNDWNHKGVVVERAKDDITKK